MKVYTYIQYITAKLSAVLFGSDALIQYYRKRGMKIGKNPRIFSDINVSEPYLIKIGDNVTISSDVEVITHDNSIIKCIDGKTDIFGRVVIGNDCFIGARSIIMYGVELADNTIVAAGSVVTKSVTEKGKIIGGNPAKIIGDTKAFAEKYEKYALNMRGLSPDEKRKLIEAGETLLVTR